MLICLTGGRTAYALNMASPLQAQQGIAEGQGQNSQADSTPVFPTTKDTNISLELSGERRSDLLYYAYFRANPAPPGIVELLPSSSNPIARRIGGGNYPGGQTRQYKPFADQEDKLTALRILDFEDKLVGSNEALALTAGQGGEKVNQLPRFGYDGKLEIKDISLGQKDDNQCIQTINTTYYDLDQTKPIQNRRTGVCQDGFYKLVTLSSDTAGNLSYPKMKVIERDTVAPDKPGVSLDAADEDNFNLYLNLQGESFAKILVEGEPELSGNMDQNGQYKLQVLWPDNYTYSTDYDWTIRLQDRAGNLSDPQTIRFRTKDAPVKNPVCKDTSRQKLDYPFKSRYPLSSQFGYRTSPISGQSEFHNGIDYELPEQTTIIAPAGGVVQSYGWDSTGGGNMLIIWHPGLGVRTGYLHLSASLVRPGMNVAKGQVIALSGSTGSQTTGPHLHFSVLKGEKGLWNDTALDPQEALAGCDNPLDITNNLVLPEEFRGTSSDPYNGKNGSDLGGANLEIGLDASGNKKYIKNLNPRPYITYIDTGGGLTAKGLAIPKNAQIKVKIVRDVGNWFCWVNSSCTRSEDVTVNLQHSEVLVFKKSWNPFSTPAYGDQAGQTWNDDPSGRWSASLSGANENDTFFAINRIHGKLNYRFPELNKDIEIDYGQTQTDWSNEMQSATQNIRNELWDKYRTKIVEEDANFSEKNLNEIRKALNTIPNKFYAGSDMTLIAEKNSTKKTSGCLYNEKSGEYTAGYVGGGRASNQVVFCSMALEQESELDLQLTVIHEYTHNYQKKLLGPNIKYGNNSNANQSIRGYYDILFNFNQDGNKWDRDENIINGNIADCWTYKTGLDPEMVYAGSVYVSWYSCFQASKDPPLPEEVMAEEVGIYYLQLKNLELQDKYIEKTTGNSKNLGRKTYIANNIVH